jgi:hypothetical protein
MGKWAKYGKRYCKDWEKESELKDWIRSVPGDESKAYCKHCKCEVRAHRSDLISHGSTDKHRRNAAPFSNARSLFDVGCHTKVVEDTVKMAELKLAAHIACHSSMIFPGRTFQFIVQSVQH